MLSRLIIVLALVSAAVGRSSEQVPIVPAHVVLKPTFMTEINLAGTSGAPVLNSAGEVVALNIGGGEQGGKLWGMGNPCNARSSLLKSALSGNSK